MRACFHGLKWTAKGVLCLASAICFLANGYGQETDAAKEKEPLHYGPFDLLYSLRGSVIYDDNIFISPDKESDVIWTATPGILIGAGDYAAREENLVSLEYTPSFILFTDHSDNNAVDHEVYLNGQWRPGRLTMQLRQAFQDFSGAVIDVGGRVDRRIYTTDILGRYEISPKTDVELEGRQVISDYDRLLDYNEWLARAWADYKLTELVKLGAGVSAGWVDVSHSVNQTYQQALLRASYRVTELVDLRGSAGLEFRQFQGDQDSRTDGVFSLGGTYRPRESTTFNIDGYRRPNTSVVLLNRNYIATGISAGVRQTFAEVYAVYGSLGYENSDYVKTDSVAAPEREDNYFFGRVGMDWQPWERLTVGVFYHYRENNSTTPGPDRFDFDNHQIAMNFELRF